jgi:hypothetical protein
VVAVDAIAVSIRTVDIQTHAFTGWEMVIPWSNVRCIFVSDAADIPGFAATVGRATALQSAKVN